MAFISYYLMILILINSGALFYAWVRLGKTLKIRIDKTAIVLILLLIFTLVLRTYFVPHYYKSYGDEQYPMIGSMHFLNSGSFDAFIPDHMLDTILIMPTIMAFGASKAAVFITMISLSVLALLFFYLFIRNISGKESIALLSTAVVSINQAFMISSSSPYNYVPTFLFFALAFYHFSSYEKSRSKTHIYASVISLSLLWLARPEMALIGLYIILGYMILNKRKLWSSETLKPLFLYLTLMIFSIPRFLVYLNAGVSDAIGIKSIGAIVARIHDFAPLYLQINLLILVFYLLAIIYLAIRKDIRFISLNLLGLAIFLSYFTFNSFGLLPEKFLIPISILITTIIYAAISIASRFSHSKALVLIISVIIMSYATTIDVGGLQEMKKSPEVNELIFMTRQSTYIAEKIPKNCTIITTMPLVYWDLPEGRVQQEDILLNKKIDLDEKCYVFVSDYTCHWGIPDIPNDKKCKNIEEKYDLIPLAYITSRDVPIWNQDLLINYTIYRISDNPRQ